MRRTLPDEPYPTNPIRRPLSNKPYLTNPIRRTRTDEPGQTNPEPTNGTRYDPTNSTRRALSDEPYSTNPIRQPFKKQKILKEFDCKGTKGHPSKQGPYHVMAELHAM